MIRDEVIALLRDAAQKNRISVALLYAQARAESNLDPYVRSHVGATGVMQIMPFNWVWLGIDDPYDPAQNIYAGAKYLRMMLHKYDGDVKKALAAYNAGPGNVDKWIKQGLDEIPFKETRDYVKKITTMVAESCGEVSPDLDETPAPRVSDYTAEVEDRMASIREEAVSDYKKIVDEVYQSALELFTGDFQFDEVLDFIEKLVRAAEQLTGLTGDEKHKLVKEVWDYFDEEFKLTERLDELIKLPAIIEPFDSKLISFGVDVAIKAIVWTLNKTGW